MSAQQIQSSANHLHHGLLINVYGMYYSVLMDCSDENRREDNLLWRKIVLQLCLMESVLMLSREWVHV